MTWVYFIECEGNHIYTGVARDPLTRFKRHAAGRGAFCLRLRRPIRLLGGYSFPLAAVARSEEYRIKQLPRKEKMLIAMLSGQAPEWQAYLTCATDKLNNIHDP